MLHSLIEEYPGINYVLAVLAVIQFIFLLHVGLDQLSKADDDVDTATETTGDKVKIQWNFFWDSNLNDFYLIFFCYEN